MLLTTNSEAFFPALAFRFFARRLISKFLRKRATKVIKNIVIRNVRKKGKARVAVTKTIQVHSRVNHLIDAHEYLSNQVWNRRKDNHSTLVISNNSNRSVKTKKIALKMRDKDRGKTEFKAKIKPIRIPPRSTVIVDLKVSKIRKKGIKKLHLSHKEEYSSSGNILVYDDRGGLSIEDLYRRHYAQQRKKGGERYESNKLNPNIIL